MKARIFEGLDRAATVAVIAVAIVVVWRQFRPPVSSAAVAARETVVLPVSPVTIDGAPLKGNKSARVAMIVFSDFECPYCARFARDTWPTLQANYVDTGRVLVAFRNQPLEAIHASALVAAEGAHCAANQSRFWEMHDRLFLNQEHLDRASVFQHAKSLGLDGELFRSCVDRDAESTIRRDMAQARTLGINGTPSFLIGILSQDNRVKVTNVLSGAKSIVEFSETLEKALARAVTGS